MQRLLTDVKRRMAQQRLWSTVLDGARDSAEWAACSTSFLLTGALARGVGRVGGVKMVAGGGNASESFPQPLHSRWGLRGLSTDIPAPRSLPP